MGKNTLKQFLNKIPVSILPAMVGAGTLANIYQGFGFNLIRHITIWLGAFIFLLYILKIILLREVCGKEYKSPAQASLYAGLGMTLMVTGSYFYGYHTLVGKGIWFAGCIMHIIQILIFSYRHVIRQFSWESFLPSWFVTYNSILVACVSGAAMGEEQFLTYLMYYGLTIYAVLLPLMLYKIVKFKLKKSELHTSAVFLSPCSLCLISYIQLSDAPNVAVTSILYGMILLTLLYILWNIPKFFSVEFHPGFAGLTFPMAVGTLASGRISEFYQSNGLQMPSRISAEISGIQLYITTVFIGFVLYGFLKMLLMSNIKGGN